jgi:hypothetical protein
MKRVHFGRNYAFRIRFYRVNRNWYVFQFGYHFVELLLGRGR